MLTPVQGQLVVISRAQVVITPAGAPTTGAIEAAMTPGERSALLAAYGGWRMLRRPSSPKGETGSFVPLSPVASTLAVEAVLEAKGDDDAGRARGA